MNRIFKKLLVGIAVISTVIPCKILFATTLNRGAEENAKTLVSKILGEGIKPRFPEEGKEYSIDGINWKTSSDKIVFTDF